LPALVSALHAPHTSRGRPLSLPNGPPVFGHGAASQRPRRPQLRAKGGGFCPRGSSHSPGLSGGNRPLYNRDELGPIRSGSTPAMAQEGRKSYSDRSWRIGCWEADSMPQNIRSRTWGRPQALDCSVGPERDSRDAGGGNGDEVTVTADQSPQWLRRATGVLGPAGDPRGSTPDKDQAPRRRW
jgi:hypothetical protein